MEDNFLKVAKKAALEAAKVIKKYTDKFGEKKLKDGDKTNFATKADTEAEKTIIQILTKHFPQHNIIAEEGGKRNNSSDYTWVIDPLDGSNAFTANIPTFSISIGLIKNKKPFLGVIYHVSLARLYWAKEGAGAYLNNKKIHVSNIKELDETGAQLDFGHSFRRQMKLDLYVNKLIKRVGYVFSFGSAVLELAMVASGSLDLLVSQAWIWDFVAGAVIVREAGGMVTDFEGKEPDWTKERLNIVASNGLIHEQILEALK